MTSFTVERKGKGICEETEPLRRTVMWGPAGVEAAIAQLLPVEISCFQEQFDVLKAREEFDSVIELIHKESLDTEIIMVRDEYARLIEEKGIGSVKTRQEVLEAFKRKAGEYFDTYIGNAPKTFEQTRKKYADRLQRASGEDRERIIREFKDEARSHYSTYNEPVSSEPLRRVERWIEQLLDMDIEKYGENTALVLNQMLVNGVGLPLANTIYARDQSNVMGKTWVWSSMRHRIRQPEVALFRSVLEYKDIAVPQNFDVVEVGGNGKFEGGDGIVVNGIAYIGVGGRTNMEGVRQAAPSLLMQGLRVVVAYDEGRDKRRVSEMDAMHLDTVAMPVSPTEMVVCENETRKREAIEIKCKNGRLEGVKMGPFLDFLRVIGIDTIGISKEDQESYAPNFVNLGNKTVVLSIANDNLAEQLLERGYRVLRANLNEITKGYGGLHCSMAPIERG